jgi:hypothetical protein
VAADGVSGDLAWWRAHRNAPGADPAALRNVLERLRGWKADHDQQRAGQLGFLQMAWDAIFGDEDEKVTEAIAQIEDALRGA